MQTNMQNMKYSTDLFNYHKDDKTFTQEASTLRLPPYQYPNRITLQNPKTLGICIFQIENVKMDDGDIISWDYCSIAGASNIKLRIWND